jgi:GTP cyclohydrolase FolE2
MTICPCAKLMIRVALNTRVNPMAVSAYTLPLVMPLKMY